MSRYKVISVDMFQTLVDVNSRACHLIRCSFPKNISVTRIRNIEVFLRMFFRSIR